MFVITIETKDGTPNRFKWSENAEGFERLWNHCEESAGARGLDLNDTAAKAVQSMVTRSLDKKFDSIGVRGQASWVVYAVLRVLADAVEVAGVADETGVLATTFDLAARQTIKAAIRPEADGETFTINLTGHPPLDS